MTTATATPSLRELEKIRDEKVAHAQSLRDRERQIAERRAAITERLLALDAEEEQVRLDAARAGLAGATKLADRLDEIATERAALEHETDELAKESRAVATALSEAELEAAEALFEAAEAQAAPLRDRERELWREAGKLLGELGRVWESMVACQRELERLRVSVPGHLPGIDSERLAALLPVAVPFPATAAAFLHRVLDHASQETPVPTDPALRELLPRVQAFATLPTKAEMFSGVRPYLRAP